MILPVQRCFVGKVMRHQVVGVLAMTLSLVLAVSSQAHRIQTNHAYERGRIHHPSCYIAFGVPNQVQDAPAPHDPPYGGEGTLKPAILPDDGTALSLSYFRGSADGEEDSDFHRSFSVAWNPISFRLVGSQIVHPSNQVSVITAQDMFYYSFAWPNAVAGTHKRPGRGVRNGSDQSEVLNELLPAAYPQYLMNRQTSGSFVYYRNITGYETCLQFDDATYVLGREDFNLPTTFRGWRNDRFARGYSPRYASGAEPASLGGYVTYFYAIRPTSDDEVVERMVEAGALYVTEENETQFDELKAPRSLEGLANQLTWRCAMLAEDSNVRRVVRPYTAARAENARSAIFPCPRVDGGGTVEVSLENLQAGKAYEVYVGAMLVVGDGTGTAPEVNYLKWTGPGDGVDLDDMAHMFPGEVYTMPFDDHDGAFGADSGANVALPDGENHEGDGRWNWIIADEPGVVFRNDPDRCLRVAPTDVGDKTKIKGGDCTVGANDSKTSNERNWQRKEPEGANRRLGNKYSNVGGDYRSLPYGQTIQGMLAFTPDVPDRPLVTIRTLDDDGKPLFFGDPISNEDDTCLGVSAADEPAAFQSGQIIAPETINRTKVVKFLMHPSIEYGLSTTYRWRSRETSANEWGEWVSIPVDEATGSAQGVVRSEQECVEFNVAVETGKAYRVEVGAENVIGPNRGYSGVSEIFIADRPTLKALEITATGPRSVGVSWEVDSDGGGTIEEFEYRYQEQPNGMCEDEPPSVHDCEREEEDEADERPEICIDWTDNANVLGLDVQGLRTGSNYRFGVRAIGGAGKGEEQWKCAAVGTTPLPPVVNLTQRSSACEAAADDEPRGCLDFAWRDAVDNGFPVTEYQFFLLLEEDFGEQFPDFDDDPRANGPPENDPRWAVLCGEDSLKTGADTECPFKRTLDDLELAAEYRLLVRARNSEGWGGVAFGVASTLPAAPSEPGAPTIASADATLTLTWIAGTDNGSEIIAYQYRVRPCQAGDDACGGAWSGYRTVRPECTETRAGLECVLAVAGLTNDEEYQVELRAVNGAGFGDSVEATGTPSIPALKSVVSGLERVAPAPDVDCTTSCTVEFTWATPQAGCPDRYEYSWTTGDWRSTLCGDPGESGPTCPSAADDTRACEGVVTPEDEPFPSGTSLLFTVRPVVDGLVGQETSVTVVVGEVPAWPEGPSVLTAASGDGSVKLEWATATLGVVQGYEYRFRTKSTGTVASWSDWQSAGLATEVEIRGLTNGRAYEFEVRAVNAVGVSDSQSQEGTPESGSRPPGAPGTLRVTVGASEVTLEWPAADKDPENAAADDYVGHYGCQYRIKGTIPWERCVDGGVVIDKNLADDVATVRVSELVNTLAYEFEVWACDLEDSDLDSDPPRTSTCTGRSDGVSERVRADGTPLLPTTEPGAPQSLVALPGDGRVTLRWGAAESEDGVAVSGYEYRWRRVGGAFGEWTDACGFASDQRTRCRSVDEWTVTSLANGGRVQFELRARKGNNLYGPVATVWATPRGGPGAPLDLRHSASDDQHTVSWRPPATDGGSPIVRYEYRIRVGEGAFTSWEAVDDRLIESGARYTLLLDADRHRLAGDVDYVVELRAVSEPGGDAAGLPPLNGAVASVSKLAGTVADDVLSASADDREVELRWRTASAGTVVRYEVRCQPEASGCTGWVDASDLAEYRNDGNYIVATVAGLVNGTAYTFEVRGVAADGTPGAVETIQARPAGAPGVPAFQVTAGDGEATLTWQPPPQDGGAVVLHYEYRWSVDGGAFGSWRSHRAGSPLVVVGGLANGLEHIFELRAVNPAQAGPSTRAAVTPGGAPGAPGQFAIVRSDSSVTLTWGAPDVDGGVAVSDYQYRYRRADASSFGAWESVGAVTVVTVAGLDNGVEYLFEVRAANAVFTGAVATASATPGGVPGAPEGLVAEPADGRVTLTWSAPETNGGLDVVRYELRRSAQGEVPGAWADIGLEHDTTVEGLTNDVAYVFELRAVNAEGGGTVASVLASPWVASAPAAPALTARPDSRQVALAWNVPDNRGEAIARFEYRWRVAGEVFGDWIDVALDTSVVVEELQNGIAHEFEVRAVNGIGASDAGNAEATPAGRPDAPELGVRAGSAEVSLSWRAPADNGGLPIERYEYRWREEEGAFVAWRDAGTDDRATARGLRNGTTYAFEVRAVNAVGAGPAATARATPLPGVDDRLLAEAWLGRFGRVSAGHVVDALQDRFTESLDTSVPLFGRPTRPGDRRSSDASSPDRPVPKSERVRHRGGVGGRWMGQAWERAMERVGDGWKERALEKLTNLAATAAAGGDVSIDLPDLPEMARNRLRSIDLEAMARDRLRSYLPLLDATSFQLAATPGASGTKVSAWGRLTAGGFQGADSLVELDGTVRTVTLGGDVERGGVLAGMAVAHSTADGGFDFLASEDVPARRGDDVTSTLTGLYPYARLRAGRVSIWGTGGTAQGEMSITGDGVSVDAELAVGMAAAGLRGVWLRSDAFEVALKSDLLRTWLEAEGDRLDLVEADANRLRLLIEASASSRLEGGTLSSSLEIGMRHDSGSADNAGGVEVGGALRYSGARRLTLSAQGRVVVAHGAEGFGEWGVSGSLLYSPRESGTGVSMRLEPAYGVSASSAERMWAEPEQRRFVSWSEPAFGIDARFGYAFQSARSGALWQPYIATGYRRGIWMRRLGWRIEGGWLDVVDGAAFHRGVAPGEPAEGGFGVHIRISRRM